VPVRHPATRTNLVSVAFLITLALHFTWEMLQAPAFVDFADGVWNGTVRCFVASVGDVLIASGSYGITALAFRRVAWPLRPGWIAPAATWIALGLIATIAFEGWALARGRWAYAPQMPLVSGVGLLPLLQWIVIPPLSLAVFRALVRRT
jgi:hypothetical protein